MKKLPARKGFPLEPIEKASRKTLRDLQFARLKWSLKHAYEKVPHYRKKFDAAGVKPKDLKTLADLAKFPFTAKADLRDTYPFGMFAVPMDKVVRIHASSGTTGKPTVVGYTKKDIDTWSHLMARSIRAAGARPGDKVHVAYGYGLFTGGLGAHYGAERLGLATIPVSGGMTERQVQLIARLQAGNHHGDALLHAGDRRRDGAPGLRSEEDLAAHRNFRRGALDERVENIKSRRGLPSRPSTSTACPRSWGRAWRRSAWRPRTASPSGKTTSTPRSSIPQTGELAARRRAGRAGVHLAHQGGAADDPLPHARPHAPAARHRAQHAPHGEDHRPLRRHADHPRRQPVSRRRSRS